MNEHNQRMWALKHAISQYERYAMMSIEQSDKVMYRRKADKCRDELNLLLKDVDLE